MVKKAPPPPMPGELPDIANDAVYSLGGPKKIGKRIILYGQGGIGKTSLAGSAPGPMAIFDLDESFNELDPSRNDIMCGIENLEHLKAALKSPALNGVTTIVIDSISVIQDFVEAWVLEFIPHESGKPIKRLGDFGFGKENTHQYSVWTEIRGLLDAHVEAGRNIILVAHSETIQDGDPQIQESAFVVSPKIFNPKSGGAESNNSVKNRLINWADHVFYIQLEKSQTKRESGRGMVTHCSGSRLIHPQPIGNFTAKSRALGDPVVFTKGSVELWEKLFGKEALKS